MYYYLVAPTAIVRSDETAFTYHSGAALKIGVIVQITAGRKKLIGVVTGEVQKPNFETKPIGDIVVATPLPGPLLALADWLSRYYASHYALALQTVLPAGLHKQRRRSPLARPTAHRTRTQIILNTEQTYALAHINKQRTGTTLLHGVPGSGKTHIYIEAAKHTLSMGRSAIILVPEIALTPQLVAEFANHFPQIVLTHSRMTEAARHRAWLEVLGATEPLVVIGPRSALFMPVANLGLVVVDEAHEPSYKQDQSPRYSALRAASVLARAHKTAKVILGTATPAVTDYYMAEHTKSAIVRLNHPAIAGEPPVIQLVDLRDKSSFRQHRFLSTALIEAMRQAQHEQRQVLLFHNRRGTSPTTLCDSCGWSALCPVCFVPMTLHADHHKLLCHICGRSQAVPPNCPVCKNPSIVFRGIGTKQIEDEVGKLFPKARLARFDADNDASQTLDKRYQEIYDGEIDIMIGTQILAKGLDVPNLNVVGVLQADTGLHMPDYQAEERVFQLLYQVAGRVGRNGQSGQVIVQTYLPNDPTIQLALTRDYTAFYREQLRKRQAHNFPPYCYLLKLTTSHKTEAGAIRAARHMAAQLRSSYPDLIILGPTPAFYERLHGHYRWQLIVKSRSRASLVTIAQAAPAGWQTDIDAANLL